MKTLKYIVPVLAAIMFPAITMAQTFADPLEPTVNELLDPLVTKFWPFFAGAALIALTLGLGMWVVKAISSKIGGSKKARV